MSDKPFPPSARRIALARRAGLTAASPVLVGGLVAAAVAIAVAVAGGWFALGDAVSSACTFDSGVHRDAIAPALQLPHAVLSLAAPILTAAALAGLVAHLAQTRALWLPRRRLEHAPALDRGPAARARGAAFDLLAVATLGAVAFAWLWLVAPRIAQLVELEPRAMLV
ncbi:MAG TPA: EscU/YscU/HrcU family type III secretion system export apparatus switch protein, partial [Kofleriaceae bacterium]|nr:EscU/YscU/HrcU family type III secretion system export apparatus switch protein [Kofleriaceae bacterium]